MDTRPKIFISYSWTNEEYKNKVMHLAKNLSDHGVEVILDQWDLKPGHDKYIFMEQSVTRPDVDKVLLICDKHYKLKADGRKGGVGDETMIISAELYSKAQQEKFIPIIFESDENSIPYLPAYIKSRMYIDLSDDKKYDSEYDNLLRNIYNEPVHKKPAPGPKPGWLNPERINHSQLYEHISGLKRGNKESIGRIDYLVQVFSSEFILSAKQYQLNKEYTEKHIIEIIDSMKSLRDVYLDFLEALISVDKTGNDRLPFFIQNLYNEIMSIPSDITENDVIFEHYHFFIWEIIITTVSMLYRFEKFTTIYNLVSYTFFIKENYLLHSQLKPANFTTFQYNFDIIENKYKPTTNSPNKYSYTAYMLMRRERLPYLSKDSLSFADILLCQLSVLLFGNENCWFPLSYIYDNTAKNEWLKLISQNYSNKFKKILGTITVEQLKQIIKDNPIPDDIRYQSDLNKPAMVLDCLNINQIASLK